MSVATETSRLEGVALAAWRSYLQSHAAILRELDAELIAEHGMTTRDYEVLLYLAQAENQKLPMSALAERTMLTRSGITRLVDGLVDDGMIERVSCESDARVSYARITPSGYEKLRSAGCSHVKSVERLFLAHFTPEEVEVLSGMLSRLPGASLEGACTVGDGSVAEGCVVAGEAAADGRAPAGEGAADGHPVGDATACSVS